METQTTRQGEQIARALTLLERLSGYVTETQHVCVSAGSEVEIDIHGTTPRVIDHLVTVYGEDELVNVRRDEDRIVRWIEIERDDVRVTFYRR